MLAISLMIAIAVFVGCAHVESPSGGPEDRSAPRVVRSFPDSNAVRVPLVDSLSFTFSEPMNRRTVESAFTLSPPIGLRSRRWRENIWILQLEHPFEEGRTYVASLATTALDRRKNPIATPWSLGFSTGDSLDGGTIEGRVIGARYPAKGVALYVWPWDSAPPDTTRPGYPPDPLRYGQAKDDGTFTLTFLPRGRPLRLAAFYDRDRDEEHDPESDFWGFLPDPVVVSDTSRGIHDVPIYLAASDEPGTVAGTAVDSSCVANNARKTLQASRAERDSLRAFLRGAEGGEDAGLIEAIRRRFLRGSGEATALTADDSLTIGAALLRLDETMQAASAESAYCATDLPVDLLSADGEVVRTAKTEKFAWSDVPAGVYHLRAYRDLNANALPDSTEPRVEFPHALEVRPLRKLDEIHLSLPRVREAQP